MIAEFFANGLALRAAESQQPTDERQVVFEFVIGHGAE